MELRRSTTEKVKVAAATKRTKPPEHERPTFAEATSWHA
jgi:hypothetical protein